MPSRILLLNGTSSPGKTTIARALRPLYPGFCYYASDQLADAGFRPIERAARTAGRVAFFRGFHHSIAAFAAAGNHLIVEHILEEQRWADELKGSLAPFDVFWVGVHCPLAEIESENRCGERGQPARDATISRRMNIAPMILK